MMKVDYDKLYRLTENFAFGAAAFRAAPEEAAIGLSDPLIRGQYRPKHAIEFRPQLGKRICDIIWTSLPPLFLVTKALRDALKREELSGWSTFPVKVYDKEGKCLRGYAGLSFLGRAGAVTYSRSKKVWRGPRLKDGPNWQNYVGLSFKDDQWDGSDFFMAGGRGTTFVTERAKDVVSSLEIPNVRFDQLSTVESRVRTTRSSFRMVE